MSENDPLGIGQPQFMANLVIETNLGLQHFQGEPPTTVVNANFLNTEPLHCPVPLQQGKCPQSIQSNTSLIFERDAYNLAFGTLVGEGSSQSIKKKAYNMGGCVGCHGVSELRGASFSFVLLAGQAGADADTEKSFTEQPPTNVP